jgi:hypothetical protein
LKEDGAAPVLDQVKDEEKSDQEILKKAELETKIVVDTTTALDKVGKGKARRKSRDENSYVGRNTKKPIQTSNNRN